MSSITFTYITFSTGRPLDGVWHTAVVVYGREYYFGSAGIESCEPGGTLLGKKGGGGFGLGSTFNSKNTCTKFGTRTCVSACR